MGHGHGQGTRAVRSSSMWESCGELEGWDGIGLAFGVRLVHCVYMQLLANPENVTGFVSGCAGLLGWEALELLVPVPAGDSDSIPHFDSLLCF